RAYSGDETQHYGVGGRQLRRPHCGGEDFDAGTALLNTAGMTFFGLDWANRSATVLICTNCSHIDWFLQAPERI
ncbi:MAG: hypothetical protein N3B11_07530, partial [Coriobacteriia bacterium]|nr:hypothetical protein [Coriobacteriia bacterium]